MGIQVEFNPDLCLRAYGTEGREKEECLPKKLTPPCIYNFKKEGQRCFYLEGEIPLRETRGNQQLSRPLASITIIEAKHCKLEGKVYTTGTYLVNEVYNPDSPEINFEGYEKIK